MGDGFDMTLANVGDVLAGKYRVDRVLGIGGMGMVVAATHVDLDQKVAIKLMLADASSAGVLTDRFLREARAVVRLRGENVCRVFDTGKLASGAPFIVMELMDGEDLGRTIDAEAPMRIERAVHLLLQALEGVAEAHAHGIVHRDLKPGNLFVTASSDGAPLVKVLDFGISKTPIAGMPAHTRTGDVMGSPGYMSPEQMVSAKDVDARADIWSLGVILYQMLAGRMPWESESLPALCMTVMTDPPPPLPAHVPVPLAAAILRCLEKDRAARFADVAELAAAIAAFGGAGAGADARRIANVLGRRSSAPARSAGPRGSTEPTLPLGPPAAPAVEPAPPVRSRKWMIAGGIAAVGLAIGISVAASGGHDPQPQAASAAPAPAPLPAAAPAPAPALAQAPVPAAAPVPAPAPAPAPASRSTIVRARPQPAKTTPAPPPPPPPPSPAPTPPSDPWSHMQHDKP